MAKVWHVHYGTPNLSYLFFCIGRGSLWMMARKPISHWETTIAA